MVMYYCDLCKKKHQKESKTGKNHMQLKNWLDKITPYQKSRFKEIYKEYRSLEKENKKELWQIYDRYHRLRSGHDVYLDKYAIIDSILESQHTRKDMSDFYIWLEIKKLKERAKKWLRKRKE